MGRLQYFHFTALLGCLLISAHGVEAIAQFVLKNGGNKCIKVDITRDLVVLVDYAAPDLQMVDPEENDAMKRRSMTGSDGDEEEPKLGEDGLDSRYNARNRRVKKNRMPDMMIQMNHLVEENGRRRSAGANKNGTRKLREDISDKSGRLEFMTGDRDGFIEICMQAYLATAADPRRFGIAVSKMSVEDYENHKANARKEAQKDVQVPANVQADMLVKVETSRITTELERFTKRIQDIANSAQSSKERESSFHQSSVSLSRAVRRYPIFRICILLVAGYMQASHVVKYMRSRHIY